MHKLHSVSFAALALLLAFEVSGAAPTPVAVQPIPVPLEGPLTPIPIGPDHAADCLLIYQSENPAPTQYYGPPPGTLVLDDLHMTNAGPVELCAFDIGYYSASGPTNIAVYFYDNDGSDGSIGGLLAGPILIPNAPAGANSFHVEVPGGTLGTSVWMGATFSASNSGLLISNPVTVGSSHDYVYNSAVGGLVYFSSNPLANMWLGIYASPAVQTETSTWGKVKAIYR